jgi:hypothetical protein
VGHNLMPAASTDGLLAADDHMVDNHICHRKGSNEILFLALLIFLSNIRALLIAHFSADDLYARAQLRWNSAEYRLVQQGTRDALRKRLRSLRSADATREPASLFARQESRWPLAIARRSAGRLRMFVTGKLRESLRNERLPSRKYSMEEVLR